MTPPVNNEEKLNKIALFMKNCDSTESINYVEQLMKEMPGKMDSFGECLHNKNMKEFEGCESEKSDELKRLCIMCNILRLQELTFSQV